MKSLRKIIDFITELNKLNIPISLSSLKCSKCRQQIARLNNNEYFTLLCLNPNCSNFQDYNSIKNCWSKMEVKN